MFQENIFDPGNFCHIQAGVFLSVLPDMFSGSRWCPASVQELQLPGPAAQQNSWLAWAPGKNRTEEFLHSTHHRNSPGNAVESHLTPLQFRCGSYLRRPLLSSPWAHLLCLILEKVKNNVLSSLEQNTFRISFPQERQNCFRHCSNPEWNKKLSGNVSISTETKCQVLTYTLF